MQHPAAALDICNSLAIRQTARQVSQFYDGYFASVGLRGTQYSILSRLARSGPLSINELAAAMVMDRTTMGRALRPLQRDGFVAIGAGRDGRTRALALTPAGTEKFAEAQVKWLEAQAAFEQSFGSDAAAALRTTLRGVRAAVSAA